MIYLLLKKYDQSVIIKSVTNEDGSVNQVVIEQNSDNTDYQAYLAWVAEGNTPLPAEVTE